MTNEEISDKLAVLDQKLDKLIDNQNEILHDLEIIYNLVTDNKTDRLKDFGVNIVANVVSEAILNKQ